MNFLLNSEYIYVNKYSEYKALSTLYYVQNVGKCILSILKVLESYFRFIFNEKIYSLCQNNSISKFFFLQNSVLNFMQAFYFHSYNNVTNTH